MDPADPGADPVAEPLQRVEVQVVLDDQDEYPVCGAQNLRQVPVDDDGIVGVGETGEVPDVHVPGHQVSQSAHLSGVCERTAEEVHIAEHFVVNNEFALHNSGDRGLFR